MLAELPSRMLAEWMAYWRLDPWGEERDDWRAGNIAAMVGNAFRGKGGRPFRTSDFMLDGDKKQEQAEEQKRAIFRAFVEAAKHGCNRQT